MKQIRLLAIFVLALPLWAGTIGMMELQEKLGEDNLVIMGINLEDKMIPGSRVVSYDRVRQDSNVPEANLFQAAMQAEGVNKDSFVVIVEDGTGFGSFHPAARLYWTFKYFGHDNVAILEGGMQDWTDMGGESTEVPRRFPRARGNFEAGEPNESIIASTEMVKAAIGKQTIVDIRPFVNYIGMVKPAIAQQAGHIDGAKSAPLDLYFSTGTIFRDKADLAQMFEDLSIDLSGESISYCNTGSFAAVGWFVISEILGHENRLYDASMKEYDGPVSTALQN
jgi:thiosulfate/3-mercaptopyruvate sulfurtransferase